MVLFLFLLFCFQFLSFCCFSFLSKKDQKTDTAETQQKQNAEKRDQKKSVSAVVFTNSVPPNFWGGLKNAIFAENNMTFSKMLSQN